MLQHFFTINKLLIFNLVFSISESQWSRMCLVLMRTPAEFQIASNQESYTIQKRQLSIHTSILYEKSKNVEDFRAREEAKEEEFNKTVPAITLEETAEEEPEDPAVADVKLKILDAALGFVHSHGWKKEAIIKGSEQVGYPGTVAGLFPRGGIELIRHYYLKCNRELIDKMKEKVGEKEKVENPKEFVAWAIKERLLMMDPYIKQWPQALAIMTLPPNVPTSIANQLTLVDDICYYSGDRSVDVSCFTLILHHNYL